jgi:hypothetical protein
MKATMSAEGIGAGLLWKLGAAGAAGVLGAAIMAAVEPPCDRKTMFKQAAVAGVGSMMFGPMALEVFHHYITFLSRSLETAVPVYFLTGALSWGAFGLVARFRKILSERAADALAAKFGVPPAPPEAKKP